MNQNILCHPGLIATYRLTIIDHKGEHNFLSGNIIRMEASDNYTIVYTIERKPFIISKVLKCYDELLRPFGFIRTHRSHLINKQFIKHIETNAIVMNDASVAKLARTKRTSITRQLESEGFRRKITIDSLPESYSKVAV